MTTKNKKPISKSSTLRKSPAANNRFAILFAIVAFISLATVASISFILGTHKSKTYMEQQELLAFRGLADQYAYNQFFIEGQQAASVTGLGMTDDNDLYADILITKIDNRIPISRRKARLHFQCHEADSLKLKDGCAYAWWYGDWEDTSAEYREAYQNYIDKITSYADEFNSLSEDDQLGEAGNIIHQKLEALNEEYDDFWKAERALYAQE